MKYYRLTLSVLVLLLTNHIFAQTNSRITVEGIARINEKPELVIVNLDLIVKDSIYNDCFTKSLETLNKLKGIFEENGINKEIITAKEIVVSESYEWSGNERKLIGYYSNIELEIKNNFTSEYSKALLKSLSKKDLNINYRIQFAFSEEQKTRLRKLALEIAISDAIEKAEIIAQASNLELTGIANVEYKSTQGNFGYLNMIEDDLEYEMDAIPATRQQEYNFGNVDLNPKEKNITKVILIQWTYKEKQ